MFIGHFAVGFAAKRFAPRASLGWLLAAPMFPDLVWPLFVLAGVEVVRIAPGDTAFTPLEFVSYPWSHSLLMTLAWAALLAALYHWYGGPRGSIAIASRGERGPYAPANESRTAGTRRDRESGRSVCRLGHALARGGLQVARHPHRGFDTAVVLRQQRHLQEP